MTVLLLVGVSLACKPNGPGGIWVLELPPCVAVEHEEPFTLLVDVDGSLSGPSGACSQCSEVSDSEGEVLLEFVEPPEGEQFVATYVAMCGDEQWPLELEVAGPQNHECKSSGCSATTRVWGFLDLLKLLARRPFQTE